MGRWTYIVALALVASCVSTREPSIPERAPAPDFALLSHDGDSVSLESLTARGAAVVVFYRGYW